MPRVYLIRPENDYPWLVTTLEGVQAEIESGNIGDVWEVKIDEISQDDLDNLLEFNGW